LSKIQEIFSGLMRDSVYLLYRLLKRTGNTLEGSKNQGAVRDVFQYIRLNEKQVIETVNLTADE
jgi:hypothetical protein